MLDQHEAEWTPFDPGEAIEWRFSRGFVESVLLRGEQLPAFLAAGVIRRLPLRSLALVRLDEVATLDGLPAENCLRRLDLTGNPLSPDGVRRLASFKALAGVRELDLTFTCLADDSVDGLYDLCDAFALERLRLGGNFFSERALELLQNAISVTIRSTCRREPDYLYRVQDPNDLDRFVTGTTPDSCQVFLSATYAGCQLALFDFEGNLLQIVNRSSADLRARSEDDNAFTAWLDELQVTSGTIRVKRFRLTDHDGIRDFPLYFEDRFETDPEHYEFLRQEIGRWVEDGLFEWDYRGGDFWLDRSGEVVAS